jgi:hypothetical protein
LSDLLLFNGIGEFFAECELSDGYIINYDLEFQRALLECLPNKE